MSQKEQDAVFFPWDPIDPEVRFPEINFPPGLAGLRLMQEKQREYQKFQEMRDNKQKEIERSTKIKNWFDWLQMNLQPASENWWKCMRISRAYHMRIVTLNASADGNDNR